MVIPAEPSRPAVPRAAPKRAGEVGTEMPGSYFTRSFRSTTRASFIWAAVVTVTVTGTSSVFFSVRVAVTVTGSTTVADAVEMASSSAWATPAARQPASAVVQASISRALRVEEVEIVMSPARSG